MQHVIKIVHIHVIKKNFCHLMYMMLVLFKAWLILSLIMVLLTLHSFVSISVIVRLNFN